MGSTTVDSCLLSALPNLLVIFPLNPSLLTTLGPLTERAEAAAASPVVVVEAATSLAASVEYTSSCFPRFSDIDWYAIGLARASAMSENSSGT